MASSKRVCTDAIQVVNCLVDGCMDDLRNCRMYHRRHKVCEAHSKSPYVLINGQTLRFCQQCSRFQSLEEFDEEKRSCRKRLAGHNRRRKTQACLFSTHSGTNMLQSDCQPVHPAMAFMNPGFNHPVDYTDYVYLLSSSSGSSGTAMSDVEHPLSGTFSTTSNYSDPGLCYASLENDFDAGWDGVTDMGPHDFDVGWDGVTDMGPHDIDAGWDVQSSNVNHQGYFRIVRSSNVNQTTFLW